MAATKKTALLTIASLSSPFNAFAEMMEKGKTKLKTVFNLYHQNSDNGNQVMDNSGREEATVIEPMIFIEHQIGAETAVTGHFVFDAWTAASDTKLDAQTGATNGDAIFTQSRGAGVLGVKQESGKWQYGTSLGVSSEYDYRSLNLSLNASRSFAKDNFTLGASVMYFMDEVDLFQDLSTPSTAKITKGNERNIFASTLTASQILTPKDLIQFELLYSNSDGYLESTASTVRVAGVRQVEVMPQRRDRYAFSTKWVHGMGEASAINTSIRYYQDSWDLNAVTTRLAYLREINEDEDFIEIFLRHHYQSAVSFYRDSFDSAQSSMTSDSDIQKFNSLEAGIFHEKNFDDYKLAIFDFENITWTNSLVLGQRSNGMRIGYYQSALGVEF